MLTKRKSDRPEDSAELLAISVLGWLAEDGDRLLPFMASSGLTPDTVRESATDPAFLAAVLDHLMGDEAVLIACATALDVKPERIAAAWRRLGPPDPDVEFG
ncbi:DUF3572 domain-containing protein [Methylobacterium sp. E-045]|jgi:hypothetical protein|uniref:DUF3572 domain-containing protein n=1 Tax=Methylobacterium sp. E-045 TaxID=2836575 RepID=UPI001FBA2678|nr:DUF3572 domain-containing protein [Methylobacterium sp. E-045]MCJ2130023.1 DUF3572 domain-containing protein [Methylobacterium sp. E-045]